MRGGVSWWIGVRCDSSESGSWGGRDWGVRVIGGEGSKKGLRRRGSGLRLSSKSSRPSGSCGLRELGDRVIGGEGAKNHLHRACRCQ